MRIAVVTLFPEMLRAVTEFGITGRAVERELLSVRTVNPREFTEDRHRTVDDRPFGGGPGMVMKAQPLTRAVREARQALGQAPVLLLSPQGRRLEQARVRELARQPELILVAGRYEGVDERFIEAEVDEEVSIGDYVLSGGELPAMVLVDAVARCLPGVLGHEDSAQQDSFSGELEGLLDCPHYTRPEEWEGRRVPEVLRSGDHEAIRRWRLAQALERTRRRRPELFAERERCGLSEEERTLLAEERRRRENPKSE